MSLPPKTSTQTSYYSSPYPAALVPPQYLHVSSPASSQYTSDSSPSPTDYSYPHFQIPQILSVPTSSPTCPTVPSYRNHKSQLQYHHPHHQLSSPTFPFPQPVLPADIVPHLPSKSRVVKSSTAYSRKGQITHPYARLLAKKDDVKRRKIWNHALEKFIFSPHEIAAIGAPQRRAIYIASLEAYINCMHDRLLSTGFWPVKREDVEHFKGLNSKTAKSMVAGLQHDASIFKLKLLELERANGDLQKILSNMPPET